MANQKTVSASRTFIFETDGSNYSVIFMSDKGNLFQKYTGPFNAPTSVVPQYTANSYARMTFSVASSTQIGKIPLDGGVDYYIGASTTPLTFNANGVCTSPNMGNTFKLDGNDLLIIGSMVGVASGNPFELRAVGYSDAARTQSFQAVHPVNIVEAVDGAAGFLTIAPGDNKYFNIDKQGDSCILKALYFGTGQEVSALWEQYVNGAWVSKGTSKTLTVNEPDVDTYATFRASYTDPDTGDVLMDTQDVQDRSDPLDINISCKFFEKTGVPGVDTNDFRMSKKTDSTAYLEFTPTVVKRDGSTFSGGTVTWQPLQVLTSQGMNPLTIPVSGGKFKLTKVQAEGLTGGRFNLQFSASISYQTPTT